MPELNRLTEASAWIELEFLEREATPESTMKLGIQMHLTGVSLADTVRVLASLGIDRHRGSP